MNAGNLVMPPHAPTPDEVEHATFLVRWWQEFLGGLILGMTGLYFRSKGKSSESAIIPMSDEEIDNRMLICKQSILLAIHDELDKRDEKLFRHVEAQDEKMINHIKDIMG